MIIKVKREPIATIEVKQVELEVIIVKQDK